MNAHGISNIEIEKTFPNRFGRMFPGLTPFRPNDQSLIELGTVMRDNPNSTSNSIIPAGYTYLGQFIDHDISKDALGGVDPSTIAPSEVGSLIQQRTPSLDLDCLYGSGDTETTVAWDSTDLAKFLIGTTVTAPTRVPPVFQNDLPRALDGSNPAKALIGDPRNDENLAVAQTHLAFLKFHNAVVDHLRNAKAKKVDDPISLRKEAKEIVVKHYQSIVLHDFLKRFVDDNVYTQVIGKNNPQFFKIICSEQTFMPIEFSVAAYRWHTLIRDAYNWNSVFHAVPPPPAIANGTLELLFRFTGLQNKDQFVGIANQGNKSLASNWIIDWSRFFDLSSHGIPKGPGFNFTKPIDTLLADTLHTFGPPNPALNLAVKNLIRGSRVGLPSAQDIAAAMGITPISATDLTSGEQGAIIEKNEFHIKTPLWYYINREAEIAGTGKFGVLASTIICEVFHGLTKGSRISIFRDKYWKPTLPSLNPDFFSMADLLVFIQKSAPQAGIDEINPIGNS